MTVHLDFGKLGEELGAAYLVKNGFTILHRNWRHQQFEIDLVAEKEGFLHFIEIKTRSNEQFGFPEENVSRKKIRFLLKAIDSFLYLHPRYHDFRLHILSITIIKGKDPQFFFIKDIYL